LDWFGALKDNSTNILNRILKICQSPWFYGDITREVAEDTLSSSIPIIVRLNIPKGENHTQNPGTNLKPYTISYRDNKKLIHTRVSFDKDTRKYSTSLQKKKITKNFGDFTNLIDLVNEIMDTFKFKPITVESSKYHKYFHEKKVISNNYFEGPTDNPYFEGH